MLRIGKRRLFLIGLVIVSLALAACDGGTPETVETLLVEQTPEAAEQPTPSPTPSGPVMCPPLTELEPVEPIDITPRPVTFETEGDEATLHGTLYGEGSVGVVLSHMGIPGTDQTSWQDFAEILAARGYLVMTYDILGYGQSEGPLPPGTTSGRNVINCLEAALTFTRSQGTERIIVIGASMGGTASAIVAAENAHDDIIGVGVISSGRSVTRRNPRITDEQLAALTVPSLWISGEDDVTAFYVAEMFRRAGSADKELCLYESTSAHGTSLFYVDPYGSDLEQRLLVFIERAASASE
jgi:predicted alpha/beta-hydrolase family hydrolase